MLLHMKISMSSVDCEASILTTLRNSIEASSVLSEGAKEIAKITLTSAEMSYQLGAKTILGAKPQ